MPKKRTFYSEEERKAHHEKKQREADLQIQELTKHWENDPKDIAEYLAFSTQFYKYSSRNTMLIYRQRPDSVFIASYTHWKELGYYVQEGEHGANIYRPETTRYFKPNVPNPTWVLLSKASPEQRHEVEIGMLESRDFTYFKPCTVFDISQTNCPPEDYPKLCGVGYNSTQHKDKLSPLTDSDEIFDKIERTFDLKINAYMRSQLLRLAEQMPTGYADRSTLIRNLKSSDGKTNIGLTNFAINALDAGSGYIYGAYGQDVTMAFLKQQSRFFTDSDANLTNSEVNFIYETYGGKPAFDCIGLIKAYEWIDEDTGIIRYQSNGFRDVGADGMFRSAVIFGEISSIPDTPGLAVCMSGHIGIYIGNGEVIEAKSNHDGVVKTQLSEGSWTYWMQLPGITYLTGGTHPYGTKKVTLENGRIKEISAGIVAGKGEFEWPLPAPYGKDYITSGSGSRYNPVTGMYENSHGAIDIGAPAMTPIYAAADGTVVMSTWHDSYGNFVKIDHGNGWSTLYAHQTKRVAKVGESVSAGDLIGYVGSTGDSTGNHLHFEIRYNDNRLDPLQFFE